MVLSNKKLKQKLREKLRAELGESSSNVDILSNSNPPSPSLKILQDSATHKPRLSKREKRRKVRSLQHPGAAPEASGEDEARKEVGSEALGEKKSKKSKIRKREVEDDTVNGFVEGSKESKEKDKNKKMKKKKKKLKKKKTQTAEENSDNHGAEVREATGLTKTSTSTTISQENGDVPKKVYVGGIPYYSTEDDIRSYFEGCGTITEVDCMTFPESGKFRGIALICFKTEAAAKRALALDGADMGGLFLKIQPYKATRTSKASDFAPKILEGYNRIYVGNLSWDITEDELRKFFSNCNITSVRFGMNKETGNFRGYAHLDFGDSQSLKKALVLDQKVMHGRPVRISCAVPLKKKPGTHSCSVAASDGVDGGESSSTGSGKMRRRTCYQCGEKGHILSACPKKSAVASTAS